MAVETPTGALAELADLIIEDERWCNIPWLRDMGCGCCNRGVIAARVEIPELALNSLARLLEQQRCIGTGFNAGELPE